MRPLTKEEAEKFFEKLSKFIGRNIKLLIDRKDDEYCFRLHKDRVYYLKVEVLKKAGHIQRKDLIHTGTCFGKFTKTQKFHLHITALDYLAQYAEHKIWLKPNQEQSFLYGNHVTRNQIGKISDNCDRYSGIVVLSANGTPLGFGVAAKSSFEMASMDNTATMVLNQADVGQYLREEDSSLI